MVLVKIDVGSVIFVGVIWVLVVSVGRLRVVSGMLELMKSGVGRVVVVLGLFGLIGCL